MSFHVLCRFTNGNIGFISVRAGSPRNAAGKASTSPGVLAVERVVN